MKGKTSKLKVTKTIRTKSFGYCQATALSANSLLEESGLWKNISQTNMKIKVVTLLFMALVCRTFAITLNDVQKMKNDLDKGMNEVTFEDYLSSVPGESKQSLHVWRAVE